jgi:hypothetical protein
MRGFGVGFGILGAVAVLVLSFAASSVSAQTATTAQPGKPLALLAGLRPPQETKHHGTKQVAHAKAAHEKTAGRTRRSRVAAHARHASARKLAARDHAHRDRALTASAFAEEPPPQAASNPQSASTPNWPAANAASANESTPPPAEPAAAPVSTNATASAASAGVSPDPDASQVQTVKITAANPAGLPDTADGTSAAITTNDNAAAAPAAAASQTVLAAPMHRDTSDVGSASWIAQVLAALGGAIAAGAVAWFLIGSGPVRTYG